MTHDTAPEIKLPAPLKPVRDPLDTTVPPRRRVRIPVGVALGLVFSVMLILICGVIIAYMSFSDRLITGRLLDQGAEATLFGNQQVLQDFFSEQEFAFRTISLRAHEEAGGVNASMLASYQTLMPEGVQLDVTGEKGPQQAPTASQDAPPASVWSGFVFDEGMKATVLTGQMDLGNGQTLTAKYPRAIFDGLVDKMRQNDRQTPFLFQNKETVIAIAGSGDFDVAVRDKGALPEPEDLTSSPLNKIWLKQDRSHDMGGSVTGRVFQAEGGMYTAIMQDVPDGAAKGWIIGTLYRAEHFGSALDQSRIVFYAAGIALLVGALISFAIGRVLGRPLTHLAEVSARIRELEFDNVEPLPASRLAELDDVNSAVNGTLGALGAFARYVPRQLVKRLIAEGMTDPRQIEIREMTIVFTDLAGFTSLASHLSIEETASFLNRYFETVSEAITAEDGTIDKYMGDGVMAFWGAPLDQPDHADHAIASVKALAEKLSAASNIDMRLRIGVHTGKVVVGNFGSESRMNYTVIGDAVNVAARLQEYGKKVDPDAKVIVLSSADTVSQLSTEIDATNIGSISLRGRDTETDVFRIA